MSLQNAYPEKPVVPYQKTTINMNAVVAQIKGMAYSKEVKAATYVMFRNESANGTKGINNNYCGFQADSSRWDARFDECIVGTVELHENATNRLRRFLAIRDAGSCLDMLAYKVRNRGLFIGGTTHLICSMGIASPADWCRAYKIEWVTGDRNAVISSAEMSNLLSMYKYAQSVFTI